MAATGSGETISVIAAVVIPGSGFPVSAIMYFRWLPPEQSAA